MPGKKILFYSNELQSQIKLYELIIASCRVNLDLYEFSSPIEQHTYETRLEHRIFESSRFGGKNCRYGQKDSQARGQSSSANSPTRLNSSRMSMVNIVETLLAANQILCCKYVYPLCLFGCVYLYTYVHKDNHQSWLNV